MQRLKFDLASHIGHKVLHGATAEISSRHRRVIWVEARTAAPPFTPAFEARDVLHAWRDLECSFFAGALLCPKVPFRRFLMRERYRVEGETKARTHASGNHAANDQGVSLSVLALF
jgi:Zn-dependent peptidase ImmA (M78 family)